MATLVKPDGSTAEVNPGNGSTFTLEELQALVGGCIQIIHVADSLYVMHEEGKLIGLQPNWHATDMARAFLFAGDYLAGDVLICDQGEID